MKEKRFFVILWALFFVLAPMQIIASTGSKQSLQGAKDLDAREVSQMIQKEWGDAYFEKIVVNQNSNRIEVDGEKDRFTRHFQVDYRGMHEAVASGKKLEAFLDSHGDHQIYQVKETDEGVYCVKAPFQTRRIVVESTKVTKNYGAVGCYIYKAGGQTILSYASETATRDAFYKLRKIYGEKNCYVDEVLSVNNICQGQESTIVTPCYSWGAKYMGMDGLKASQTQPATISPVTVAVLDTGISSKSSIFQGTQISSQSYNFADGNSNVKDVLGHGTHVAGIIANLTPDQVNLLVLKIADKDGSSTALMVELALNYAIEKKADVINLSFGFMGDDAYTYSFLDNAIDKAYKKGIPVCVAAGNRNAMVKGNSVNHCYPACNEQTICISSIEKDGSNYKLASYSYYGNGVDFCAPGSNIISAGLDGGLLAMNGTSMAAPHVTAAVAYLKMMQKDLSVQGVCLELRKGCIDLGSKGKDAYYGYGCPNLAGLYDKNLSYADWKVENNLSAPTLLACVNDKNGTLLNWSPVSDASGYHIYRRKHNGINEKIVSLDAENQSYTDSNAKDGSAYSYYVVAYGSKRGAPTLSGKSNLLRNYTLKPVTISKTKALGRKKAQIKLKKQKYWKGKALQVQFSTAKTFAKASSRNFKASLNSVKLSMKKRGTFYVRARTRYKWGGRYYYSTWATSKVKVR